MESSPQKHSRRGLFNKRPFMRKNTHFTRRWWSVANISPICLCLLSSCDMKECRYRATFLAPTVHKTLKYLTCFMLMTDMLSFFIKFLNHFSVGQVWFIIKSDTVTVCTHVCMRVCESFFSAYVTGSVALTNTHLEPVKLQTLLVITTLKMLVC